MRVFADLAARHGIEPTDDEAVDDFFVRVAPTLPEDQQVQILSELLRADPSPFPPDPTALPCDSTRQEQLQPPTPAADQVSFPATAGALKDALLPVGLLREYAQISPAAAEKLVMLSQVHFERALQAAERRWELELLKEAASVKGNGDLFGLRNLALLSMFSGAVLSVAVVLLAWQGFPWAALAATLALLANLGFPMLVASRILNFLRRPEKTGHSTDPGLASPAGAGSKTGGKSVGTGQPLAGN
jgi:hypothetical protein